MKEYSTHIQSIYLLVILLTTNYAYASSGLEASGLMLMFVLIVLPAITLGLCFANIVLGTVFRRSGSNKHSIIIAIVTFFLAAFNFLPIDNFLHFLILPILPLSAIVTLLLSQIFGFIRVVASYVLILTLAFLATHLPQYDEVFLKKFDPSGKELSNTSLVNYELRGTSHYYPPSRRIFFNHRLAASSSGFTWLLVDYKADRKSNRCSGFALKKYDLNGPLSEIWESCVSLWEDGQTNVRLKAMIPDRNEGVFVVGENYAHGTNAHSAGTSWWIKRFDKNGAEDNKWKITFREKFTYGKDPNVYSIATDRRDGLYVVGGYCSNSGNAVFVRKFRLEDGIVVEDWNKTFPENGGGCHNSTPEAFTAVTDSDDNLYVLFNDDRPSVTERLYSPALRTYTIRKFDSSGVEVWSREVFSTVNPKGMVTLTTDDETGLYVLGVQVGEDPHKSYSPLIKKFDLNGEEDLRWNKILSSANGRAIASFVSFDSKKDVFIVGYNDGPDAAGEKEAFVDGRLGGSWWLRKFKKDGTEIPEWNKTLVENSKLKTISHLANDSEGNLFVLGEGEGFLPAFLEKIAQ